MSVFRDKERPGQWRAKFMVEGMTFWKKGFKTKAEGKAWEAEERRKLSSPQEETPNLISFVTLAEKYLEFCQARMVKNTVQYKSTHIARFIGWMEGDFEAESFIKSRAHDYINHVAVTKGNIAANRALKDLHATYAWGEAAELVTKNPFHRIQKLPEDNNKKYIPSPAELEKVIVGANRDELDLLEFLYQTGARISEAVDCTWDDVNLDKDELILWTRKRKNGERQPDKVPVGEVLKDVLLRRLEATGGKGLVFTMPERKRRKLMRGLCDEAGVPYFTFHSIRHYVASLLAETGQLALRQVQIFLRHRNQSTTEGYLHELTRGQKEVVGILGSVGKNGGICGTNLGTKVSENGGKLGDVNSHKGA